MDTTEMTAPDDVALADGMKDGRERIIKELRKLIVGQEDIINQVLLTLFVGGNSLIVDRKSTRLNSSHSQQSRMPSSA